MTFVIDQSNNNKIINFADAKAHGCKGYIHKVTEGDNFVDRYAASRLPAARKIGMKVGLYHFAKPSKNPGILGAIREANFYCQNFLIANGGALRRGNFNPILDFEDNWNVSHQSQVQWIKAFNKRVKERLGKFPIFYTYYYKAAALLLDKPVGSGLWLAGHPVGKPITIPAPWKNIFIYQSVLPGFGNYQGEIDVSKTTSIYGLRPLLAHPLLG